MPESAHPKKTLMAEVLPDLVPGEGDPRQRAEERLRRMRGASPRPEPNPIKPP